MPCQRKLASRFFNRNLLDASFRGTAFAQHMNSHSSVLAGIAEVFNKNFIERVNKVEVILLEKMRNLGALGDKVKVTPGFARNYLIPQGKAVYANKENVAKFEQRRAEFEKLAKEKHERAQTREQAINALPVITITAKAGDEGKLFGSIGTRDIVQAMAKENVQVEKKEIRLPEGTLRMTGEYEISIELESDVVAKIKVNIVPEG